MISRLSALSRNPAILPRPASVFQQFGTSQNDRISQISSGVFSRGSSTSTLTHSRIEKSTPPHDVRIAMKSPQTLNLETASPQKHSESKLSLEEYIEKYEGIDFLTFDQYKAKNEKRVESDERGSALSKFQKGYQNYVSMCHRARTEPPLNPLII